MIKHSFFLFIIIISFSCEQEYHKATLTSSTKIIFADSMLAVKVVTTEDDYTRLHSAYERSAAMKTDKPVSSQEYMTHLAKNVMKWNKDEKEMFSSFTNKAAKDLKELSLNLPDEIILIKTTSEEFVGVKGLTDAKSLKSVCR